MKLKLPWQSDKIEPSNSIAIPLSPAPRRAPDEPGLSSDTSTAERWGTFLLLLGLGGFIAWASLAPLDEGVPTQGMVTLDTKRKTVQHLTGGIVEQVMVREAQLVKTGDPLIKLNEANARANFEAARQRYLSLRAMEDRLLTEQRGEREITFHPDVRAAENDPMIRQHVLTQTQLLQSRRQALESELSALGESAYGQAEAAKGLSDQLAARGRQLQLIQQEKEGLRSLVDDNYAPKNKLLELERQEAEIRAGSGDVQANLARARRGSSEVLMRRNQRREEFRREIDGQLAEVRRELAGDEERYKATREELERTLIRAPATGMVVGIINQTVGGVIQAGARIMDVVPHGEALILETRIPPHLIDRLKAGQVADVRFSGFSHTPMLVVQGQLSSVSADLLSDPTTGAGYYLGRVSVTPEGLKTLGERQLQPGMPVEIVIKTGERSLLNYVAGPLIRRIAQGLKEE